jgi:hypothetical protein
LKKDVVKNINVTDKDLTDFKISMVNVLNIIKKYNFCNTFYDELTDLAFTIGYSLEKHLENKNVQEKR